jgi:hypothetical protein
MMNNIILISKKARKKLRLARYPALVQMEFAFKFMCVDFVYYVRKKKMRVNDFT